MDDDELTRTAYHESGHAVVAAYLGGIVERITVEPESDDGPLRYGDTQVRWYLAGTPREQGVREIKVALAGPAAEIVYLGDLPTHFSEWHWDWQIATDRAHGCLKSSTDVPSYVQAMAAGLLQFVRRDDAWATIAAMADELEAHGTLYEEHIADVVRQWPIN